MKSIISKDKVKELLPQKFPFQMVSHLLEYEEDSIVTGLHITKDNIFIENGGFNESGMIENIAQSIALHISYRYFKQGIEAPVGYIGSISKVVLTDFPLLGENITTQIDVIKEFMGVTLVQGKILSDDKVIMTAQMKTFLSEEPTH